MGRWLTDCMAKDAERLTFVAWRWKRASVRKVLNLIQCLHRILLEEGTDTLAFSMIGAQRSVTQPPEYIVALRLHSSVVERCAAHELVLIDGNAALAQRQRGRLDASPSR